MTRLAAVATSVYDSNGDTSTKVDSTGTTNYAWEKPTNERDAARKRRHGQLQIRSLRTANPEVIHDRSESANDDSNPVL
jgi:hypothetical protein